MKNQNRNQCLKNQNISSQISLKTDFKKSPKSPQWFIVIWRNDIDIPNSELQSSIKYFILKTASTSKWAFDMGINWLILVWIWVHQCSEKLNVFNRTRCVCVDVSVATLIDWRLPFDPKLIVTGEIQSNKQDKICDVMGYNLFVQSPYWISLALKCHCACYIALNTVEKLKITCLPFFSMGIE